MWRHAILVTGVQLNTGHTLEIPVWWDKLDTHSYFNMDHGVRAFSGISEALPMFNGYPCSSSVFHTDISIYLINLLHSITVATAIYTYTIP